MLQDAAASIIQNKIVFWALLNHQSATLFTSFLQMDLNQSSNWIILNKANRMLNKILEKYGKCILRGHRYIGYLLGRCVVYSYFSKCTFCFRSDTFTTSPQRARCATSCRPCTNSSSTRAGDVLTSRHRPRRIRTLRCAKRWVRLIL